MKTRLIEAVGAIEKYIVGNTHTSFDREDIGFELESQGFNDLEIKDAFNWIVKNILGPNSSSLDLKNCAAEAHVQKFRILSHSESLKISPEAYDQLILFFQCNFIDEELLETVIERAMLSDKEYICVDDIRLMTALVALGDNKNHWKELLVYSNVLVH